MPLYIYYVKVTYSDTEDFWERLDLTQFFCTCKNLCIPVALVTLSKRHYTEDFWHRLDLFTDLGHVQTDMVLKNLIEATRKEVDPLFVRYG